MMTNMAWWVLFHTVFSDLSFEVLGLSLEYLEKLVWGSSDTYYALNFLVSTT